MADPYSILSCFYYSNIFLSPQAKKRLPPWGKLRLSKKMCSPLGPLCEGAPPAGGGGENGTAVRNISGYGKVLSLRPFGAPLPLWRKRHLPRIGGVCLAEGGFSTRWASPRGKAYLFLLVLLAALPEVFFSVCVRVGLAAAFLGAAFGVGAGVSLFSRRSGTGSSFQSWFSPKTSCQI